MAYAPIAFIAPNYRDYKNWWLKAYEPGTTTPKAMSDNDTGSPTVAKYELNKDGFIVSSGDALVIPYVDGDYDLWLFPTEVDADANDTTEALRVADDISPAGSDIGDYTYYLFDSVQNAKDQTPIGGNPVTLEVGDVIQIIERENAIFDVGAFTTVSNGYNKIDSTNSELSYTYRHYGRLNLKAMGAIGSGIGSETEDTGAFGASINLIESGEASILFIPDPDDFYYTDLNKFENTSNFKILHQSTKTHVKLIPKDLTVVTNTYVYQFSNCSDFTVEGGKLDGNKDNQLNTGGANNDHECIDLKSCTNATVVKTYCIDAFGEGVDLDSCTDCTIENNNIYNCGGWGIHNSIDSVGSVINNNKVDSCGVYWSRGGIDGFKSTSTPALYGSYTNNRVTNCYQNYNIEFNNDTDKLKTHYFDSSNTSTGGVIEDTLTGVTPLRMFSSTPGFILDRGYSATGCRFGMPDANTVEMYRYKESDGTDELIYSFNVDGSGLEMFLASSGIDISPTTGTKWRFKRNGSDGFLEVMNDESGTMERVFAVDKDGDIELTKAGKGLVLVSPDGLTTRKLTIDNSGALAITGP